MITGLNGQPFILEGEFLKIDPPRKLVHTWHGVGTPGAPTTVTTFWRPWTKERVSRSATRASPHANPARPAELDGRRASNASQKHWLWDTHPVAARTGSDELR